MLAYLRVPYTARLPRAFGRRCGTSVFRPHAETLEDRTLLSTFVVDRLSDTGDGSGQTGDLRYCLTQATSGHDKIIFAVKGTINLTSPLPNISLNIAILGPGADALTIRRDSGGDYRIFTVIGAPTVKLSGLTITNGQARDIPGGGGGIYIGGGQVKVAACRIIGNFVSNDGSHGPGTGGGLAITGGQVTIVRSSISNNRASDDRTAGLGGGLFVRDAEVAIEYSTVSGNIAVGDDGLGGGIYGKTTLVSSTISGNGALFGGGIWGGVTAINSTISGNNAQFFGGGIYTDGTDVFLTNSTVSHNGSVFGGGGIRGGVSARDTIIAGNDSVMQMGPDLLGNLSSRGHNLIGNTDGGSGFDPTDLLNVDPLLGPLQDNGGPTQTMALLPESPAIDAGDNTDALEWDQRGPGYPRISHGSIDIGAFELQQAVAPTVTCSVAQALLWPPNHRLVNVGLSVTVDPPDANLHLLVYANDNANPSDAADIGSGTLQLRSERQGNGDGRLYLIVVTATNSGGTSFDVYAVAVPHDRSPHSLASAAQQAAAAEAYYQELQTAPPGYDLLGEGPDDGGASSPGQSGKGAIPGDIFRHTSPVPATSQPLLGPASVAAGPLGSANDLLGAWAAVAVDHYFATASAEGFRFLVARPPPAWPDAVSGATLDLLPDDDWLLV